MRPRFDLERAPASVERRERSRNRCPKRRPGGIRYSRKSPFTSKSLDSSDPYSRFWLEIPRNVVPLIHPRVSSSFGLNTIGRFADVPPTATIEFPQGKRQRPKPIEVKKG
jgi:hypothetical protein